MSKPFIAAINSSGEIRAMVQVDDAPDIVSVIETLSDWAETDPSRRIVIATSHQDTFAARSGESA